MSEIGLMKCIEPSLNGVNNSHIRIVVLLLKIKGKNLQPYFLLHYGASPFCVRQELKILSSTNSIFGGLVRDHRLDK